MKPVCLITPPSIFLLDERVFMNIGVLKVAAALEARGRPVEMLDLSGVHDFEQVVHDHARASDADFFGITATTPQLPAATKIARAIKRARPYATTILGGPHATLVNAALRRELAKGQENGRAARAFARLREEFDRLVAGDGEDAIELALQDGGPLVVDADDPKGSMFLTGKRLTELPLPARHLVDVESYHYSIDGHRATSLIAQLGCPYGCGFSVTGDTLVFTDHGFERIDSLISDQYEIEKCWHGGIVHVSNLERKVSTSNGVGLASSVVHEGKRRVFEVKTDNGLRIRGTEEHPFMTLIDGVPSWKALRHLRPGDWLVMKNPEHVWPDSYVHLKKAELPRIPPGGFQRKHSLVPTTLTDDLAWLTGYLIGDGCLPADGRASIHVCVTDKIRGHLKRIVKENFGFDLAVSPSKATTKMDHGWIHSRAVYEFFVQSMGVSPFDKLRVPNAVVQSPRSIVQAFLRGLWDADGYESRETRSYLTTVSYDLAREVAQLLLMLGEVPSIQEIPSRHDGWQTCYRVGQLKRDRIPTDKALYRSTKTSKWYWRTPRNKKSFLGVKRKTLEKSGLHHDLNRAGWHFVRVKSITPGLVEDIYDLRVPEDQCFVANGLIVHNCAGRDSPFLRRIRTRTTESIVNELITLHMRYGFTGFMFYDDELNVNKEMVGLMNAIVKVQSDLGEEWRLRGFVKSELFTDEQAEAMARAGFRWILVGFESGSDRILANINKRATRAENTRCVEIAHRHGLKVKALMSLGHPGENAHTIGDTKRWLLETKPDDFDVTIITAYPGSPYYDHAVPHESRPGHWVYEFNGDRLYQVDVDYTETADYYKGDPDGGYTSYVYTDQISREDLVGMRDAIERRVRLELDIAFNPSAPAVDYEHSMGQTGVLPLNILRRSNPATLKCSVSLPVVRS